MSEEQNASTEKTEEAHSEQQEEVDASSTSSDEVATEPSTATPEQPLKVERRFEDDAPEEEGKVPSRLSRIASGAFAAVNTARSAPGAGMPMSSRLAVLRKFMMPIITAIFLITLLVLFKEILLPFILALVIVYLMEPIVGRVGRTPEDPSGLPRWVAVILVYLTFFGVLTTTLILIMPRFVSEVVRFTETVPEEIQSFRSKTLPELNKKVKGVVGNVAPPFVTGGKSKKANPRAAIGEAKKLVWSAHQDNANQLTAVNEARRLVNLSTRMSFKEGWEGLPVLQQRTWQTSYSPLVQKQLLYRTPAPEYGQWLDGKGTQPSLRVVPDGKGGMSVYLDDVDVEVSQTDEKTWHVRRVPPKAIEQSPSTDEGIDLMKMLDLERGLDKLINKVAKSSSAKLTSLLGFVQAIVVGIIQAFVALVLTLMVAAFISIDLHTVMRFFKMMFPKEHHEQYDILLKELDRGLSGVVRGQLMICLVNGVLTFVGLWMLNIKFSLLLALVAGCLSLIPIFGTIISTIPIVLFGLTSGLTTGLLALLWILFIHFLEANILNPKIIGTSAHIHPVIVIFALLAGESAFGLMGALLAVPTASILLTLFKFFLMRSAGITEEEMAGGTEGGH